MPGHEEAAQRAEERKWKTVENEKSGERFFKIMPYGCLDILETRLHNCCALLHAIVSSSEVDEISEGAVYAAAELLEYILSDFRTDVDAARDYKTGGAAE